MPNIAAELMPPEFFEAWFWDLGGTILLQIGFESLDSGADQRHQGHQALAAGRGLDQLPGPI